MMNFEECQEWGRKMREEKENLNRQIEKIRREELMNKGINPDLQQPIKPKYDHPGMPDDGFVTVLYVIGMLTSLIFNDFWILWIGLTILYVKFITRHDND